MLNCMPRNLIIFLYVNINPHSRNNLFNIVKNHIQMLILSWGWSMLCLNSFNGSNSALFSLPLTVFSYYFPLFSQSAPCNSQRSTLPISLLSLLNVRWGKLPSLSLLANFMRTFCETALVALEVVL